MRKAYKPVLVELNQQVRTSVDQTVEDFASTMHYGETPFPSREDFLNAHGSDWEMELHYALKDLLEPSRSVLGLGSGECEHEIRFFMEGYNIAGSDVVAEAFSRSIQLFPGFKGFEFDIFTPDIKEQYDDLLVTGLDFYFDRPTAQKIFDNARHLLKENGRLIFVLRYQDNLLTWLIDVVGIPIYYLLLKKLMGILRGKSGRYQMKFHGYRRSRNEIVGMAFKAGFRLKRVKYAGYGVELMRVNLHNDFPGLYAMFRRLDRRLCLLNNATVFEFVL